MVPKSLFRKPSGLLLLLCLGGNGVSCMKVVCFLIGVFLLSVFGVCLSDRVGLFKLAVSLGKVVAFHVLPPAP